MPVPHSSAKPRPKVEPTLREQVNALTKKVNKLAKQNKLLQEERKELATACTVFREMRRDYYAMNAWTTSVYEQISDHHRSIEELNYALNRAKERSLLDLKPFKSALGKLADEGATPIDRNGVNLFRAPIA